MRDNLLFFNVPEEQSFESSKFENCIDKILNFFENDLTIVNAKVDIKIDRANRGGIEQGKIRPVVVKFNFYGDKCKIKDSARSQLRDSSVSVSDQFPKATQDRRKKLIPYLLQAQQQGKDASLSYDVLYSDKVRFTHDRPSAGQVPELPQHHNRNRPNAYPATGRRSGP
ncbi:hypothetical protein DPMN_094710 [Dreissena polymorpha]|uniref:Uncharacterized protein n=1 Tax=Dreissena polymorpha TaxID=45954 RepID=A0A9D4R269_DREPO|nr:hypothetical protein DPMN_094710 [Dreissena polymorpha]